MRMRRKKNFDKRYESCIPAILDIKEGEPLNIEELAGGKPLMVEIGCGKGKFINEMARNNPDIYFIAMEKEQNVLIMAIEKAIREGLPDNLRFIDGDAEKLLEIFPKNSVNRIFINFCDPWPPKKQAKRRLTHSNFLNMYNELLKDAGEVHFKTDNRKLFEFSLNEIAQNEHFLLRNISLDLHSSDIPNVTTEYEEKFSAEGMNIYRLEAHKK